MTGVINTERYTAWLRERAIRPAVERLLISKLSESRQAQDFTKPANCSGMGRLRHFRRTTPVRGWPPNPLPIEPAAKSLQLPAGAEIVSQVFQNAACNWRCWYCFVPNELLEAREDLAAWMTADELLALYLAEPEEARPRMIDLTGGQPDLTPEWVLWMMRAIRRRGLEGRIYLWSDDNLSTDLFWRVLRSEDVNELASFRGYGRVACFKGFDDESFSFNTSAAPELFSQQFSLFDRMRRTGVDLYAYATLTAPTVMNIADRVRRFMDRLQAIHPNLPLRTVPLNIHPFEIVKQRLSTLRRVSALGSVPFDAQKEAVAVWQDELGKRFTSQARTLPITEVTIAS